MILQSLYRLYKRLPDIDRPGFAPMALSWAVVLDRKGNLVSLEPLRRPADRGNRLVPVPISAPTVGKRTVADKPGFLADKTDYVFGCHLEPSDEKQAAKLLRRFDLFRALHLRARADVEHPDFDAVCLFLESWDASDPTAPQRLLSMCGTQTKPEDFFRTNVAFQISGSLGFVHHLPGAIAYWTANAAATEDENTGLCLITGQRSNLARLHEPAIKGVNGAQTSGASIVSFNIPSFASFAKEQGFNAPVSEAASFGYCTALNWLLARRERHFRIGDTTTVFWTAEPTPAEVIFPLMISGVPDAEDQETRDRVRDALARIANGTLGRDELGDPATPFFILGLAPNASRLSVRFWHTDHLGELAANLRLHLNQLEIARQRDETNSKSPESVHPTIYQLLRQTSRDADGIPPLLGGALMRSILLGTRYPDSLVKGVMRRIRVVEKNPRGEGTLENVTHVRAAILKAWLMRNHSTWLNQHHINMTTALDKDNPSAAYQLGRLFAVFEQAQRAAHDYQLDRTIRETMFSSASANPLSVFGRLDRLNKNHLGKLTPGSNRFFSDLIDEIHQKIKAPGFYPASLNLKEQGLFCIGYYHQRHDLRPKKQHTTQSESTTV